MAKLDIYKPGWIDVVFAGRNKAYGAYELRKENPKTTSRALLIGATVFVLAISGSTIYKYASGFVPEMMDKFKDTEIELAAPPPIAEAPPPPPPPPPPAPVAPEVRFPPPVVVPAEEVKDQEPPTISDLKLADVGPQTIAGDPNAEIKIEVVEAPKITKVVEEQAIVQMQSVQIQPQFPGGPSGWGQFMQGYNYPTMARENNVSGRVLVTFVVEKDGSLTDIQVVRDIGFGTGEEAVRLLKTSPKWSPGVQNGIPVRVQFTQPIVLSLN